MKAREHYVPWSQFSPVLVAMRTAAEEADEFSIKEILREQVHGYGLKAANAECDKAEAETETPIRY